MHLQAAIKEFCFFNCIKLFVIFVLHFNVKFASMIKSKVTDIFQSFSKDDLKKFGDYLNSPLFNKREIIVSLFSHYKKYHPDFSDKSFTKEKIHRKLFPGKTYNDENFRNLNSILLKHAEDFLSFMNYSKDSVTVKKHLLSEINHRNLLSLFEKHFSEAVNMLEGINGKDLEYFYKSYSLFLQKDIYNSFINRFSKEDIVSAEKNLITFFLIKIMEMQNYVLYECRILGKDKKLFLKDNFCESIFKSIPDEIAELPQIKIYFNALKLEQTNKEIYYRKLREMLKQSGSLIEKEKHYNMYIDMIDFIKRTKPKDDISTTSEIFELRKEILEKNLFTKNFITNMFFLNVVKSGIRLGKFEWIDSCIKNYCRLLNEKYRDSTKELSFAYLNFGKKNFDVSLSHLSKVRYEDTFYNLEVRNLTSRIYYENNMFELLNDFLNSYRIYISKNRAINEKEFSSHNLFISLTGKLTKIKEFKKFHKLYEITEKIKKQDFINRLWIIEKIKELEKEELK